MAEQAGPQETWQQLEAQPACMCLNAPLPRRVGRQTETHSRAPQDSTRPHGCRGPTWGSHICVSKGAPDGALQVVRGGGRHGKHVLLGWQTAPPHACASLCTRQTISASRERPNCPFTLSGGRWSAFDRQSPILLSVHAKSHVPQMHRPLHWLDSIQSQSVLPSLSACQPGPIVPPGLSGSRT